jgi:aminocarboxymuconate-semialdehyde decarboxylase
MIDSMPAAAPVVDVHAHVLLPGLQEAAADADPAGFAAAQALDLRRQGPESARASAAMIRDRWEGLVSLPRRLADMRAAGIDVQVVSPSPSHYYPWADRALADRLARSANEAVAALVAEAPERLLGLGLIALQHPDLCASQLEHAIDLGLAGVELSSFAPGVELSDERLEPLWHAAEAREAVLFLHPFGCSLDERLDRFYLSNTVGQPVENAVALSQLIFAGVLDRHPSLRVVAAHGGGYLPTAIGRSDHAWRVRPEARTCAEPPSSYLRRIWFDSLTHSPEQLEALVRIAGPDRVVLGSDYPFDMGVDSALDALDATGLGEADRQRITRGNAAALFSRSWAEVR